MPRPRLRGTEHTRAHVHGGAEALPPADSCGASSIVLGPGKELDTRRPPSARFTRCLPSTHKGCRPFYVHRVKD